MAGRLVRVVRATGAALISFAETVSFSNNPPDIREWDDGETLPDTNPRVDSDTAEWFYRQTDSLVETLWPVIDNNPATAHVAVMHWIDATSRTFTEDQATTETLFGLGWEIARAAHAILPGDLSPERTYLTEEMATLRHAESGVFEMHAEVLAFFDAALRGDLPACDRVIGAVYSRSAAWRPSKKDTGLASFLSVCLVNLSASWAGLRFPEYMTSLDQTPMGGGQHD